MNADTTKLFLHQSYLESSAMLKNAISQRRVLFWDHVAVTTATYAQAEIYGRLIGDKLSQNGLPKSCRFFVEPDRNEERIGSGGSTLCVLAKLFQACGCDMKKLLSQRSLILHSGGDAKRLPHSAPLGKLFTLSGSHVEGDMRNAPATVFDDLMVSLAGLPSRMNGGVVIVSADAFFRFNHTQIDLDTPDAVAFAMKAPVMEGTIHGVFLEKDGSGFVHEFLHKLPEDALREKGAVSDTGKVDLDIGITYLGENAIRALLGLILDENGAVSEEKLAYYANERVRLSLYGDIIYPMAQSSTLDAYLKEPGDGQKTQELTKLRPGLFEAMHPVRLRICRFAPGEIRNMGTTEEALETLRFFREESSLFSKGQDDEALALISHISENASVGRNCFIENTTVPDGAVIGDNCLISGCDLPEGAIVPDGIALHCVPLKEGKWVVRVWGVQDDIKSARTWLNKPFDIRAWDESAGSLWNARLFPVCADRDTAYRWAMRLVSGNLSQEGTDAWRLLNRLSLADTAVMVASEILRARGLREDSLRAYGFSQKVLHGGSVEEALAYLGSGNHAQRRIELIQSRIASGKYAAWQDVMRLYMCLSEAAELLGLAIDTEEYREMGFAALREATAAHHPLERRETEAIRWACDSAEVALPIRANWGGTWSDAPPYCFERGGTMLNAAVSMDGHLPIFARAQRIDAPVVVCVSEDLKMERRYTELDPLMNYQDPTDAFILFKAALSIAGVLSPGKGTLKEQLSRLGGGVCITTKVDIPKGSGLGTSSIIAGALIDVLMRLAGRQRSYLELSDDVLLAEQLMTTGGGWQDAIGGMFPGIKLTYTEPGIPQRYDVQPVTLPESAIEDLNCRGFLLYTGQRRLARSVLRRVLSNYVCNHEKSLSALEKTQRLAVTMAYELRRGNVSAFGQMLSEHMRLLCQLDSSSSNLMLDHIMDGLHDLAEGVTLCGAAGGGFMYGVTKQGVTLQDVRLWLQKEYEGTAARLYQASIVDKR